jgi:hypothetical protein
MECKVIGVVMVGSSSLSILMGSTRYRDDIGPVKLPIYILIAMQVNIGMLDNNGVHTPAN